MWMYMRIITRIRFIELFFCDAGSAMNTRISFIIPLYNAESTIERCVSSVLRVMESEDECIIVNDGSTDRSLELIRRMNLPANVKVLSNENHGVSYSRNDGLNHAKGDYIFFVDSDDQVSGDLTKLRRDIQGEDMIVFKWRKETLSTRPFGVFCGGKALNRDAFFQEYNRHHLHPCVYLYIWNKLYRRETIEKGNVRYREDMSLGEDCVFNASFLHYVNVVRFSTDTLYTYNNRHSSASLSVQRLSNLVENSFKVAEAQYRSVRDVLGETKEANAFVFKQLTNCFNNLYSHGRNHEYEHLISTYQGMIRQMHSPFVARKYQKLYNLLVIENIEMSALEKELQRQNRFSHLKNALYQVIKKVLRRT